MDDSAGTSFAALLREYRLAAGLTQEELAERAGLSARAISDLERGLKKAPYRYTVEQLAGALDLEDERRTALLAAVQRRRGPVKSAPPRSTEASPLSLAPMPADLTPLVGREREVAAAIGILRSPGVRLLTLTGAGGVGKTRLSLRIASVIAADYADGVALVLLAPIRSPGQVADAIAGALGLRDRAGVSAEESVREALQHRELLLVLDNFEHLMGAALFVVGLLAICPRLTLLVSSREWLHVRGEHLLPVPPLPTPPRGERLTAASAARFPAVSLFLDRARAVVPDLDLPESELEAAAEICHAVDGLPLAIELAAAHVRREWPSAILARLQPRLPVLTEGPRDLPERQRTMEAAIGWSYDLLTPEERRLFRLVSIFVGGFEADAAAAVAGSELVAGLAALQDQSLLQAEAGEDGAVRYSMLETIREYGLARLRDEGKAEAAGRSHAFHFLALAEEAEPELRSVNQAIWLARLDRERPNLRAAFVWLQEHDALEEALRLASALQWFWVTRMHLREGREWLESMLVRGGEVAPRVRAKGLSSLGRIVLGLGNNQRATELYREALAIEREIGDTNMMAIDLNSLGATAYEAGAYEEAARYFEESLDLRRELGFQYGVALQFSNLGNVYRRLGDLDRAEAALREALAIVNELGETQLRGAVLNSLGVLAESRGDIERAIALYQENLALQREINNTWGLVYPLINLGLLLIQRGEHEPARRHLREALELCHAGGQADGLISALQGLARIAVAERSWDRAARLLGALVGLREQLGVPLTEPDRVEVEEMTATVRARMLILDFDAAQAEGQAMGFDEAVAFAAGEGAVPGGPDGTARERT